MDRTESSTNGSLGQAPEVEPERNLIGRLRRLLRYPEPPLMMTLIFLLFVVARYMNWGARRDIFRATRFEFVLGAVVFALCLFLVTTRPPDLRRAKMVIISISTLFFFMLVQLPFAADPDWAQFIFMERVIKFVMLTFFMIVLIRSPRNMKWFLVAFLVACFYVTQESVQGLISGGLYWENQGVMRLHGSTRMYAHPNSLAGVAMGTIPFIIFLFPVLKNRWIRLGLVALLCTSTICVIYSGSRTAYVAIVAFAFYWWLVSGNKGRFIVVGLVVATIAVIAMPEQYKDRFKAITGDQAEGHSRETRIEILEDALIIFKENPMGVGIASFPEVRMARFGRKQDTHNLYLEVATNLGIQGLLAFFFYIYCLFWASRKSIDSYTAQLRVLVPYMRNTGLSPPLRSTARSLATDLQFLVAVCRAMAGFIFVRLILGFFGMDMYEVYWWFGGGLAISLLVMTGVTASKTRVFAALVDNQLESET